MHDPDRNIYFPLVSGTRISKHTCNASNIATDIIDPEKNGDCLTYYITHDLSTKSIILKNFVQCHHELSFIMHFIIFIV